jgi:hypothetical protein
MLSGVVAVVGLLHGGCDCNPDLFDPPGDGFLRVYVELVPGDAEVEVGEISMTLSRADVVIEDPVTGDAHIHTIEEGDQEVTIAGAASGVPLLVLAAAVPAGFIRQVRLVVSDASVLLIDASGEVELRGVKVPSGHQTGIKLSSRSDALLEELEFLSILGTIDLGHQLVFAPGNDIHFKPVIPGSVLDRPALHDYLEPAEVMVNVGTRSFPITGRSVERAKVFDTETLRFRNLVIDAATGLPVSFSELRLDEDAAWRARSGALHPAFASRLEARAPDELVDASVWVETPPAAPLLTDASTPEDWDADHAAYVAARQADNAGAVDALVEAIEATGAAIVSVEYHPPKIGVTATRQALEAIAFLDGVSRVFDRAEQERLAADAAADMVQEPLHFAHALGSGTNLRIAIVEPNACIRDDHDDFALVTFEPTAGLAGRCYDPDDRVRTADKHSTNVAGALATARGLDNPNEPTRLVGLFGGRLFESFVLNQTVLERNPHLINRSVVIAEDRAHVEDSVAFMDRIFVANGSGRFGLPDGEIARCFPHNSLCVGGYIHDDTIGVGKFFDDKWGGSLWENNPATGREEPKLVGATLQLLADVDAPTNDRDRVTGTSFATPSLVGFAALVTANFPSKVLGDPTLLRAVMLASASHPIEDFPGEDRFIPSFSDGIDDRTGFGVPRGTGPLVSSVATTSFRDTSTATRTSTRTACSRPRSSFRPRSEIRCGSRSAGINVRIPRR